MASDILDSMEASVPHVSEYFGLWAMLEEFFRSAVDRTRGLNLRLHVAESQQRLTGIGADQADAGYSVRRGDLVEVGIVGPVMKYVSSLTGGTSSILTRRRIRRAAGDESVKAIVLRIDSPGGTVSGTYDLADDVASAAKKKPVTAYIEDLGASAAYAVASQARKIYANKTALVGSIGTYGVIVDASSRAEKLGLKVHVVRAGQFKGAGEPGTEITEEQLDEWQRVVDELNEHFLTAIASGRGMSRNWADQVGDGRVHVGAEAAKLRLIDGVRSFDQVLHELQQQTGSGKKQQTTAPPVASQTGSANTPSRPAHVARARILQPSIERKKPMATQKELDANNVTLFNKAVQLKMTQGMSRRQAVAAVVRENPELHKAFLLATNRDRPGAISQLA